MVWNGDFVFSIGQEYVASLHVDDFEPCFVKGFDDLAP